jgi:hypothetical protein
MSAKGGSRLLFGILVIGGLSVAGVGCSDGGSGNSILGPSPVSLAGDYTVTETITSDTCGTDLPPVKTGHIRLSVESNGLELTDVGPGGTCSTCESEQDGSTLTQTRTETLTNGVCTLIVETTSTITFADTTFTSIENRHFSYVSGECFGFTSCDLVTEGQGEICSGCWPGCSAAPASLVLGAGSQRMVFQLATVEE